MALLVGPATALQALAHTALLEYIPFILLLLALFTVAGGIVDPRQHPRRARRPTRSLLAIGTVLASLIGTTGASMVMIRPVLRANDDRRHNVHVVVFFIFLVSNIGGSLTPLGDPPLFLGFLRGVDFFWTTQHLWPGDAVRRRHPAGAVLRCSTAAIYRQGGRVQARSDARQAGARASAASISR